MKIRKSYWLIFIAFCLVALGGYVSHIITFQDYECNNKESTFDEETYTLGLIRGCDIGCIDYDLRQNNMTWNTSKEQYNVLISTKYKMCSAFCVESFR